VLQWLSFIGLFFSKCNLHSPILNFNSIGKEALKGLEHYLPAPLTAPKKITTRPVTFNLLAAAVELKNSFRAQAFHLPADRLKLFYVRIPKSGSTSIASEMLKLILPELKDKNLTPTQVNFLTDAWINPDIHSLKSFTGFTVVRHPLERLASVYRDIFDPYDNKPFLYQNYLGGILHKNLSFDDFVLRISRIPDRLKDQHFRPQYLFLEPYQRITCPFRILKLEHSDEIAAFMQTYGMGFPHLHKSRPYNPADYYSEKSLWLAQKVYTKDFKLFGYEQKLPR
jgi:hypothetical protein